MNLKYSLEDFVMTYWTSTHQGGSQYSDTGDNCVDFFAKAGSMFTKRGSAYGNPVNINELFDRAWTSNPLISMKLLLWLRDCRGGAGNRSGFRSILTTMSNVYPEWILANLHWIPVVGRWDDLRACFGTPVEARAAQFWADALKSGDILAAKWADRKDRPLRLAMGLKIGPFRRFLANLRKTKIVEHKMCSKQWNEIEYGHVPSVAMSRYTKAFAKNDSLRFAQFKDKVVTGDAKVNASTLYPHDCVRTVRYGDREMGELQFEALPNFLADESRIMVIADTSGSMDVTVSGMVRAVDVSQGLALYCSAKMPKDSPFYKRFIGFSCEGHFVDWREKTFAQAIFDRSIFNRAVGTTRIDQALNTILNMAIEKDIPQMFMPDTLMIVSDMQFAQGARGTSTEVDNAMTRWDEAGYDRPKILYWDTWAAGGGQALSGDPNVGLVSGFSPSILKAVFNADDFSPRGIMLKALEKYSEIVEP